MDTISMSRSTLIQSISGSDCRTSIRPWNVKLYKSPRKMIKHECACQHHCIPKSDPFLKMERYKLLQDPEVYNPFNDRAVNKEDIYSFVKCATRAKGYRLRNKTTMIPRQRYRGDQIETDTIDPSRLNKGIVRILRFLKPVVNCDAGAKIPNLKSAKIDVNVPLIYPNLQEDRYTDMQNILDIIFPPIEWVQNNKIYQRQVSPYQATTQEIKDLNTYVQYRTNKCKAQQPGCCEGRYRLMLDVFDELLRQETIACPERGLLLARVKEDIINRIEIYKELTHECEVKLVRILHLVEDTVEDMKTEIDALKMEIHFLDSFLCCRTVYYEEMLKDLSLSRLTEAEKVTKDLKFYEHYNDQLKKIVDDVVQYGRDEIYREYEYNQ